MNEQASIGYNEVVLIQSIYKRLIEACAGRGGVEAICQFIDNISWLEELRPLREKIKADTLFFEYAVSKCHKDMLKRPIGLREEETANILGASCSNCNYHTSLWITSELGDNCPKCGSKVSPLYVKLLLKLINEKISPLPETILMYVAYDRLADAYALTYQALQTVLKNVAQLFNWERFVINEQEIRIYLEQYKYGRLTGEQRIPREEKQILQFIVFGTLAGIPFEDAELLIRLGLKVVKYGYLFQVLGATGAEERYGEAVADYHKVHDIIDQEIRERLSAIYGQAKTPTVKMKKTLAGYYAPCLLLMRQCWITGQMSSHIRLEPIYKMPVFPLHDFTAIQAVYAPSGGGKSFLISGIACYSILHKRSLVLTPLNDRSNSLLLASLPLFPYDSRTKKLHHYLTEILEVEPQGVPSLTMNLLRRGETIEDAKSFPPTRYDVIVEVPETVGFKFQFKELVSRLKEIASEYGYNRSVGFINTRNFYRLIRTPKEEINLDIQISSQLMDLILEWRRSDSSSPARLILDEISYIASSQINLYARDAFKSQATVSDLIKEARRHNIAVDITTQLPLEILPDIRSAATNIFFRDLPKQKDRQRSQIHTMLESLQLEDKSIMDIVEELNEKDALGKRYWFWYHKPSRRIRVIRPSPPTFCLQDPKNDPRTIYRAYEKKFGEKILLKSWDEVPKIKAEPSALFRIKAPPLF